MKQPRQPYSDEELARIEEEALKVMAQVTAVGDYVSFETCRQMIITCWLMKDVMELQKALNHE